MPLSWRESGPCGGKAAASKASQGSQGGGAAKVQSTISFPKSPVPRPQHGKNGGWEERNGIKGAFDEHSRVTSIHELGEVSGTGPLGSTIRSTQSMRAQPDDEVSQPAGHEHCRQEAAATRSDGTSAGQSRIEIVHRVGALAVGMASCRDVEE